MRTTLTLDDDVAAMLAEVAHQERRPFKHVVNDALRRGLKRAGPEIEQYFMEPHESAVRRGYDVAHLSGLAEVLEDDEMVRRLEA